MYHWYNGNRIFGYNKFKERNSICMRGTHKEVNLLVKRFFVYKRKYYYIEKVVFTDQILHWKNRAWWPNFALKKSCLMTKFCIEKKVLNDQILNWKNSTWWPKFYYLVFQQDSVSGHTSWRTQSWPRQNFCDHISFNLWPTYSPE